MTVPQIVIDTNVLIAAFRLRNGASLHLLSMIDSGRFEINLSVPMVLEYEVTNQCFFADCVEPTHA